MYIDLIRKQSSWGKNQTILNYEAYITQELAELNQAIYLNDLVNILEELADVYMMLCFYWKETSEQGNQSYELTKNVITVVTNYINDFNITLDDLKAMTRKKLEIRYPILLSKQVALFIEESPMEEFYWNEKKRYYKMLEFCSCQNVECSNYHKPYDGSNLMITSTKSEQKNFIFCPKCGKRLSLKKSVIFYGINKDYKIALKAAVEYFTSNRCTNICEKYDISSYTLNCLINRCKKNYDVFKQIADLRYPQNKLPNELTLVNDFEKRVK